MEFDNLDYNALCHLISNIFYGGRVTDDNDLRLLNCIIKDFINPNFENNQNLFQQTNSFNLENIIQYIENFPENDNPTLFGLHSNCSMTLQLNFTN